MKPSLREFPDAFESARLVIRSPLPGDGAAVNEGVRESIERIRPWLPWAQGPLPTVEETEARLREGRAHFLERTDLPLLLFLKDGGTFIGGSGLHRMDWNVPKFEIGYWLRTGYEGRGLMTEAVAAITAFAFDVLDAHRVEIRCDPRNVRSAAIPERLGFVREALLQNDARDADGDLRDTAIYAKVR